MSRNIFTGTYINNDFTDKNNDKKQNQSSSSSRYVPPYKKNHQMNSNNCNKAISSKSKGYNNKYTNTSNNTFKNEFKTNNNDFPSLCNSNQKESKNNTNTLNFSNVINYKDAAQIGSKKVVPPQPKKFVTLVNKNKKKTEEIVEFESDEETQENYIDTDWYPYISEEEEEYYMNEEEYRRQETDYDY